MRKNITHIGFVMGAIALTLGLGQVARAGHTNPVLSTVLDGSSEIGSSANQVAGDATGIGEAYVFGVDGDPTTLCYVLVVSRIQQVPVSEGMAAHIHEGSPNENGPVVAALAGPEDGNAGDCLTEGEPNKFPTNETGIVQRILNNPEDFYINVHNPQYPDGAIRGQLASDHTH